MDVSELDTSLPEGKPDLPPLPESPPDSPVRRGWNRGARDWAWSELRGTLNQFTGGAATYNDQFYDLGLTVLELLKRRARGRALAFPPGDPVEWTKAGLRAASFSVREGTLHFQGPGSLPEFAVEESLAFAARRADRALSIWGWQVGPDEEDPPDEYIVPGGSTGGESAPDGPEDGGPKGGDTPQQPSLFD